MTQSVCLVAFSLGAGAVWGVTGEYAPARGVIALFLTLGASAALSLWGGRDWAVRAAPLWAAAGWFGGAVAWDWALVAVVVMVGLGVGWAGSVPATVGVFVVLAVAVVAGAVPVWCLLALIALPPAWNRKTGPISGNGLVSDRWAVAFNLQLLIGFLIKGMVR